MPSASPSATATMTTSSTREFAALLRGRASRRAVGVSGCLRRLGSASAAGVGASASACLGLGGALAPASRRRGSPCVSARLGLDGLLDGRLGARRPRRRRPRRLPRPPPRAARRRSVMQRPARDPLRARVPALAHAGALADAVAQVVELGAAHVTAGGDLDPLDLRASARGNVRSTPTPNDCLRTVKVSRTPWPWRLMTTPSKTWVRRRVPSMTWKWTRTRSPAWKSGTRRSWARSRLSMTLDIVKTVGRAVAAGRSSPAGRCGSITDVPARAGRPW